MGENDMKTAARIWLLLPFLLLTQCNEESAPAPAPMDVSSSVEDSPDGTPDAPYPIEAFPFVQKNDTTLSSTSLIDTYNVAPTTSEKGPEFYYRLVVPAQGTLKAEVKEAPGVDVDIHLLDGLGMSGSQATQALARANTKLTVNALAPGVYWIVVDSYSDGQTIYAGAYKIAVELDVPDQWQSVAVAPGITWKKKIYSNLFGGAQTVNVLDIDLNQPAVKAKPAWTGSCLYPSQVAQEQGAVASINGGFFGSGCQALCLVKIDGQVKSYNKLDGQPRRGFGVSAQGLPLFGTVNANADWPQAWQAINGHPNLVTSGQIDIWPAGTSGLYVDRHPRTALGLTASNHLLLVTVDGRTAAGKGMKIAELAQYMIWLGAAQAINLDGGGSTTMWIQNQSINGVVNHPSDNQQADHYGERKVSDAVVVILAP